MSDQAGKSTLDEARAAFRTVVDQHGLAGADVAVHAASLTAEEAIGRPGRDDFPIIEGKEVMVEAVVLDARGQAFNDAPGEYRGTIDDLLAMPLTSNRSRALFVAALNATMRALGLVEGVIHCKDTDPAQCGLEITRQLGAEGCRRVGLIGFNPAIAEALAAAFGSESVLITDLDRSRINTRKFGIRILDGRHETEELIKAVDMVLVTGTTLVNGSFDGIHDLSRKHGTHLKLFGVTAAGVSRLLDVPRICPYGRS